MTTTIAPICVYCTRFHQRGDLASAPPGLNCDAFPDRIPAAILNSLVDHRKPYEGDHGLQFLPETHEDAQRADIILRIIAGDDTAFDDLAALNNR
jgi:hypothetical protein